MANENNLININDRPADEALAIRQSGGRAAAKARQNKRQLRERLETMLSQPVNRSALSMELHDYEIEGDGTYYDALCATLLRGALDGNGNCLRIVLGVLLSSAE